VLSGKNYHWDRIDKKKEEEDKICVQVGTSKQSLAERKKENFIFTVVKHIHNTYVWPNTYRAVGEGCSDGDRNRSAMMFIQTNVSCFILV